MSLCNTFRLFVLSLIIVLSCIDTPAAFTLRRTTVGEPSGSLAQVNDIVDVKNRNKRSSDAQTEIKPVEGPKLNASESIPGPNNELRDGNKTNSNDKVISVNKHNSGSESQVSSTDYVTQVNDPETTTDILTTIANNVTNEENEHSQDTVNNSEPKITTNSRKVEFNERETTTLLTTTLTSDGSETTTYESANLPTWKKYTTIDRKRVPTTINDDSTAVNKTDEMIKAETTQLRSSLKDTFTSDIPSLEQLKNDLLQSSLKAQASESGVETLSSASTEIITSTDIAPTSTKWDTFESKRAGYLDLSGKGTNGKTLPAEQVPDFKINAKETIRAMFQIENTEIDIPEKIENKAVSQSQLSEDSIKEELLKEKLIKENEENAQRFDSKVQSLSETQISNSTSINSSNELSVKPINNDKAKNTSLYTVNPNYKPLKKIEVQAPKQFVRDPDDNSWRNESLSSLGIVFKPKNSSKPFTQVLKNKTETEWNTLTEKDSKNDIPDLKERLQKMAEKRKSKRKKTDSFGNVIYFDYEENSSSHEHIPTDPSLSSISSSEETPTTVSNLSSNATESTSNTTSPLTLATEKPKMKGRNPYSTKKFRKFFNIPEYYDTTDEDDTDYLNMAKIDIKKFSTSTKTAPTTVPPVTQRPWAINKSSFTISPERKATVQYFPPRTTQKVNINDYDNDFKVKVNSFTSKTEEPKNVLPISLEDPTTPFNAVQYTPQNTERQNDFGITSKPDFGRTLYPTQPPQTTQTELTLINDDRSFDRDSYVVRHYKDFINEAAKDSEFDKNMDYVPYTDVPSRDVTKNNFITYVTEKPKMNMDNEYDYDAQFRKDVLQRFVDNFNRNSDRFKSEFPVLFNSSVIHRDTENGREVASSRAFMRGLYNTDARARTGPRDAYDPNGENMTVELSPSYELHYYMPEQEEKEEVVPPPVTLPYQYRL